MTETGRKHQTISGVQQQVVYTPKDVNADDYDAKLGMPGHYPFTSGITEQMYRDSLWIMGSIPDFSTPRNATRDSSILLNRADRFSIAWTCLLRWAMTPTAVLRGRSRQGRRFYKLFGGYRNIV